MGTTATIILALGAALAIAALLWLEKRPKEPGQVRLLPTTPLLFLALLALVLILAHAVTLMTGHPHMGRFG